MAMVFQNYALYPFLNVEENIGFPLKMAKVERRSAARGPRGGGAARAGHAARAQALQLSGGQRQRVAMGRAIVRPHTC